MATYTTNLNLKKPDTTDYYSTSDNNANLDKVDTAIGNKADKASITAGTAGTSSATTGSSLSVPYVTVNAQGIVTGYGTHTHSVTGFAASSHTHDDRYYTEAEMDTKLNTQANAASITAGTAGTSSATSGSSLDVPYVTTNAQGVVTGYGTHTHSVTGFAASSHTHSYAGSSSAGGAATTAISAATTTPATASLKNIQASTTDLTAGTSALTTGTVYLVYE